MAEQNVKRPLDSKMEGKVPVVEAKAEETEGAQESSDTNEQEENTE